MMEFFSKLPPWIIGNAPVWALLVIAVTYITLQWLKNKPLIEKIASDERLNIKTGYRETIQRLEDQVTACHEQSRIREQQLQEEIDLLKNRLNNEAWQRVQSEISLVNVLMEVVEAPQLKRVLTALEKRQTTLMPRVIQGAEDGNDAEGS